MDEKEEKEASYLLKLCRWHEANLAFKKLIVNRYSYCTITEYSNNILTGHVNLVYAENRI